MAVFSVVGRSIRHRLRRTSQPYFKQLFDSNSSRDNIVSFQGQYQSVRTLILESAPRCLKINRLSGLDSGIAEVCLDRPQAKNAIGRDLLKEFILSLEDINNDPSLNILLITSLVPKVFCAGADLKERKTMDPSEVRTFVNSLRSSFSYLEALRIPSIAVIEGAALGGGLELALSCDLRICGESATMSLPETGLAIIPGAGGTQRLPRLVGKSVAKELIFTGRKFSGSEAASMGIVNYCVPTGEARLKALEIAQEINQKGPVAIRMAKRAIDEGLELDMSMALDLEEDCYENVLQTKDRVEGLAAFAEKRKPRYTGE